MMCHATPSQTFQVFLAIPSIVRHLYPLYCLSVAGKHSKSLLIYPSGERWHRDQQGRDGEKASSSRHSDKPNLVLGNYIYDMNLFIHTTICNVNIKTEISKSAFPVMFVLCIGTSMGLIHKEPPVLPKSSSPSLFIIWAVVVSSYFFTF